jgi:hypothetical protein
MAMSHLSVIGATLLFVAAAPSLACDTQAQAQKVVGVLQEHKQARAEYDQKSGCLSSTERLARATRSKAKGDEVGVAMKAARDARARGDDPAACGPLIKAEKAAREDLADIKGLLAKCSTK